ncbi:alpha-E domain-containing protein [Aquimarina sp. ERC-38]|uniref:alpha-E domain-containing protein n=1 Tax=Aquimarina sp. ERC-38 TaxID=2949996 RepID=UPI002246F1A8|nr:alpha-E domain-containing protein [Aquimarina sp. ERC-38]UZO82358.1 alpha-E domain-containing protein [Aquimarina sp. ERC-38]
MLARVANNLFWMGRYIERSEHVARYLCVNYFSSLDAPNDFSQSRQFVLQSLRFMVGDPYSGSEPLHEPEVLFDIGLNTDKEYSIINCVKLARENANSARDLISTELYEAINKFYHFVLNYSVEDYKKRMLYDFTTNVMEFTAILKAKIRTTLLQDEVYSIIKLGVNLERAMQVIRIINAKYNDILVIKMQQQEQVQRIIASQSQMQSSTLQSQSQSQSQSPASDPPSPLRQEHQSEVTLEWSTLLKCIESYDMMRRYHKKAPDNMNTLDFLILNTNCPRSVVNSLAEVANHIQVLSNEKNISKNSSIFLVNKIYSEYKYKYIEEIEVDFRTFIEDILEKLVAISKKMEEEYFAY